MHTKRLHTNGFSSHASPDLSDRDARLQASRRLDWRFLLPDPTLRRVAYVGKAHGGLLASLQTFAGQVDRWETPPAHVDVGQPPAVGYDVVVAHAPDEAALRKAVALAAPTGCVYVEAQGLLALGWRHAFKAAWSLPRYLAVLRGLGMDAAVFWFWPDFDRCTRIIPFDDVTTFLQFHLSAPGAPVIRRFLQAPMLQRIMRSRLAQYAVPCFGIVAQHAALHPSSHRHRTVS